MENNKDRRFTLREICTLMGIELPERFNDIADEKNENLTLTEKSLRPGGIIFNLFEGINVKSMINRAVAKGAKVIFLDREDFEASGLKLEDYPCILMENKVEQVGNVFATMRDMFDAKVVSITGTVGKTTAKRFCDEIVSKEFNTYVSPGNTNSYMATAEHIFERLSDDQEVFIQETGAASINSVRKAARMLKPNAFILLNVTKHHMNHYGTFENLFEDKSCTDDYLQDGGVVITNYDDEAIAAHQFKHKVITFGITTDKEVDYRATNIVQNREMLEFDVEHKAGVTHVKINILGKHNAYNALAAFALARWLGISTQRIVEHFAAYRSFGIRQNLQNIGGHYLYMDCYNVCEASILATTDAFLDFPMVEGGRKIAVIGGENKLGDYAKEISTRIGSRLGETDMDEILFFGTDKKDIDSINKYGDAYSMMEGIQGSGKEGCQVFTDLNRLVDYLKATVKKGDVVIFKGIYLLDMAVVADKVFGSAFSYDYEYYYSRAIPLQEGDFYGHVISVFGEAEITNVENAKGKVTILDSCAGYPVHRIGRRCFIRNENITAIDFGKSVKNIGQGAFFKCTGLTNLTIPGNVKVIERGAFRMCTGLKTVTLEEGVEHLGQNCFRATESLEEIRIPNSVTAIENDVFKNSDSVVIICESGSYAETYARENNIRCRQTSLLGI